MIGAVCKYEYSVVRRIGAEPYLPMAGDAQGTGVGKAIWALIIARWRKFTSRNITPCLSICGDNEVEKVHTFLDSAEITRCQL